MTNHFGIPMKEKIVKFEKSKIKGKKYKVTIKNKKTSKERTLHFGGLGYEQYKDSTPLKLYKNVNHNTKKRRDNYFSRHSGIKNKKKATLKEIKKSKRLYNAKILSHIYLW
tara:strand:+ start:114 stop:446 length:333 start_codon:yes stop_codon:yes gene_type:complete